MGNIKINADQYLGEQELNRLLFFIKEAGYEKILRYFVESFGVSFYKSDSLEVVNGNSGSVTITSGAAIDNDFNAIVIPENLVNKFVIPNDGLQYFIVLRYEQNSLEEGSVEINTDGAIIGTDTKFQEVLRGYPSNPVLIRFPNSTNNTGDYNLLEVNSDENALLNVNGSLLIAESNQKYQVVGSFTPNQTIDESKKLIYQYDDYEIELRQSSPLSNDLLLASVVNNGASLVITDLRNQNKLTLVS